LKQGILITALLLMTGLHAYASTHNLRDRQVYIGKESYNEHLTGKNCFVTIHEVIPYPEKGLHCHKVNFQFSADRTDIPRDPLLVDSRVTNYHRPEFPQTRTCAMNVNGTTSGDEIYGEETEILYNQVFGGQQSVGGTQYDYFLTLSSTTKLAVRARIHVTQWLREYDVDCVNLELM
jgi:hypothetical protein